MNVLVVGATSAIAEATARLWAARGDALYLVARRESLLEASAADLRVRGARAVIAERFDITDRSAHEALLARAEAMLGPLDCVLIAHGTLPDQAACLADVALAEREIDVNANATSALALRIASRFEARGAGTLAVITSVAGVRGRASNFVYGAAKAMVSTLLEGLRHRLHARGVAVIDIRPGFVDTPMTAGLPKNALYASARRAGRGVYRAIEARRDVAYVPWFWRPILLLIKVLPESVFKRLRL